MEPGYVAVQTPTAKAPDDGSFHDTDTAPPPKDSGKMASLREVFSFADGTDWLLMALGAVGALGAGGAQPVQILLFGDVLNALNSTVVNHGLMDDVEHVVLNFVYVGLAVIVGGFMQVACWSLTASRQTRRLRSAYVGAIMAQDVGWFDAHDPMQMTTRVVEETAAIQEGIGRKFGDVLNALAMALTGITIALVKGWDLALILMAFIPFIAGAGFLGTTAFASATKSGVESYATAGAIAQEALANVRTVHMFNAVGAFIAKYQGAVDLAVRAGTRKGFAVGAGLGLMFLASFATHAGGLFYGAYRIAGDHLDGNNCVGSGCYDGGRVLTVFYSVIFGASGLGQVGPSIQAVFAARAVAFGVFKIIKREPAIDSRSLDGKKLQVVTGKIDIDRVTFAYPSRPDVDVCRNYSLEISSGETVALVGPSGSGKSTIVSLLERFYDPSQGSVRIDGHDARELNVKWLREQIGLVGQEPVLFATSIMENIRYGRPEATEDEVQQAARMANAYDFVMDFPDGFDTEVGERGTQLSGGQKQRIAIARAIIKNPPILILDEATSALDAESESIVQASLDALLSKSKRTTIIVAHRLSTIRNADKIAVHSDGAIVELGSHAELMQLQGGHYRSLIESQSVSSAAELKSSNATHEHSVVTKTVGPSKALRSAGGAAGSTVGSESEAAEAPAGTVSRVWRMTLPDLQYLVIGGAGAIVNAAVYPAWAVMLVKATVVLFDYSKTKHEMLHDVRVWSLGFVALGVAALVAGIVQQTAFAAASQRTVARVRIAAFSAMLRQEVGWFDREENSSGALVSRLATDAAMLQAVTSDLLNQSLLVATTLLIGFTVSFFYSWQMTLVIVATAPLQIFGQYIQADQFTGAFSSKKHNDADAAAGSLLAESLGGIRTVASFGMEQALNARYGTFLDASKATDAFSGMVGGTTFGFSSGMVFLSLAFILYLGGRWIDDGVISFEDFLMVVMIITFSSIGIGFASQAGGDVAKAKQAARRVFTIIDRVPAIDATSNCGEMLSHINGDIEFRSVEFAYPARPDSKIYREFSLHVGAGQTVALVGASGSGKSTAISLLERFYDPTAGSVTLDGTDIRQLRLSWLRERISLVSQEPVLFAGTIADNIAMGKPGASREEVVEAAKKANAFDFISNFPTGLDTDVGDRGAQVSGGQKQRIAIARAILRDPEVLLLDEATSALDNESERVVQASLDALLAAKKRTTIVVAHRLSTIRNADMIAVTQDGSIVEQGTHDQLVKIPNGIYKALVERQMNAH